MLKHLDIYRKIINPPYKKSDYLVIFLTFLLLFALIFLLLQKTATQLYQENQVEAQITSIPLDFQNIASLTNTRSILADGTIDLNNNSKKEFILTQPNTSSSPYFNFYELDSNGLYSLAHSLTNVSTDYSPSYYPGTVGDADNDGKNELLIYGREGAQSMYVKLFEALGANDFPSNKVWETTTGWWTVGTAIDDLDKDGKKEIVFAGQDFNSLHKIHVFENAGDNTYNEVWSTVTPDFNTAQCFRVMDDLDGDGKKEMVFGGLVPDSLGSAWLHMYENTGDNTFSEVWTYNFKNSDGDVINCNKIADAGDLDGDGKKEFIAGGNKTVKSLGSGQILANYYIFESNGDNSLQKVAEITKPLDIFGDTSINLADLDNDGKKEVIVTAEVAGAQDGVYVYKNTGDNTFSEVWSHTWTRPSTVAQWLDQTGFGDYNNNQKTELLFNEYSSSNGTVQTKIYESNNGQIMVTPTLIPDVTSTPSSTPTPTDALTPTSNPPTPTPTSIPTPTSTPTAIPTPTPTPLIPSTITIQGHHVDNNGNDLILTGQKITLNNGLSTTSTPTWYFNTLSPSALAYTVTATNIPGYTIYYSSCVNCTTHSFYTLGNSVTVNLPIDGNYADIFFKYLPIPTPTPTPGPIIITNVYTNNITRTQATVLWTTSGPGTSKVLYGTSSRNLSFSSINSSLTNEHAVTLTGLSRNKGYYFKVYSKNSLGVEYTTPVTYYFKTLR